MNMMGIDILWPTGVQVPWCFQCPLVQRCFNWRRRVSYTKPRERLMEPLCFHLPNRAVSAAGCFGLDVGQGPSFPFLIPFCKFMFLVIPMKQKSIRNCFVLIKITKMCCVVLLSVLTLKKSPPKRHSKSKVKLFFKKL